MPATPTTASKLHPKVAAWFDEYDQTHSHPMNRVTHKFAIPIIVFHIVAMLQWAVLGQLGGLTLTVGHVFAAAVVVFYASLDVRYAAVMAVYAAACLWAGTALQTALGLQQEKIAVIAIAAFGWMIQLAGHAIWEKKSPAFLRNLVQALVGPVYFIALLFGEWRAPSWAAPQAAPAK